MTAGGSGCSASRATGTGPAIAAAADRPAWTRRSRSRPAAVGARSAPRSSPQWTRCSPSDRGPSGSSASTPRVSGSRRSARPPRSSRTPGPRRARLRGGARGRRRSGPPRRQPAPSTSAASRHRAAGAGARDRGAHRRGAGRAGDVGHVPSTGRRSGGDWCRGGLRELRRGQPGGRPLLRDLRRLLVVTCPSCGAVPARPGARFCDACGSALDGASAGAGAAADQSRKVVTVVFADLVGSTSAQEGADPEAVRRWVDRYYAVLRQEVESRGGRVAKFTGDGVMAVFGDPGGARGRRAPRPRGRDRAARCRGRPRRRGRRAGAGRPTRRHQHRRGRRVVATTTTWWATSSTWRPACRRPPVPGQTLVGESTFRLVRLGAQLRAAPAARPEGQGRRRSTPSSCCRCDGGDEGPSTPFVGRAGELDRLLGVLDAAICERRARLASIVGSPGVGKTRLARELALSGRTARSGRRRALRGQQAERPSPRSPRRCGRPRPSTRTPARRP